MPVEIELAESLPHALELLSGGDPEVRPVAGATDVLLRLHAGRLRAHKLVSIADLKELSYLRVEPDAVRFGAGTPLSALEHHLGFVAEYPGAAASLRQFASPQIRNRATVGGNIGNASPAADMVPPLMACGATLTVQSKARGARTLPLHEVFLGFGKTQLLPDELICEVAVPRGQGWFQAYSKFGSRGANVIAVVNASLSLRLEDDRIAEARVAYGSVAPRPLRAVGVEDFLRGQPLSEALVEACAEVVRQNVSPIDDVRGSKRHKIRLAVNATQDALWGALSFARAQAR
jgi:CO/xanthine dehydrogenase FAD-binding subunit